MTDKEILASATLEREDRKNEEDGIKIFYGPVVKTSSIEIANALNTFQNLCLFHEFGNDMLELLQRFQLFHLHDTARKQSSILTYFNQK